MSYLEECMSLGKLLSEEKRLALFKFLLKANSKKYENQSKKLLENGKLETQIANGEIIYLNDGNSVKYSARKMGSQTYSPEIRQLKLGKIKKRNLAKLKKFMAQSEVEVITNFPLDESNSDPDAGFGMILNPFYDLNYYSHGRGKILGFIEKIKSNDSKLLNKF